MEMLERRHDLEQQAGGLYTWLIPCPFTVRETMTSSHLGNTVMGQGRCAIGPWNCTAHLHHNRRNIPQTMHVIITSAVDAADDRKQEYPNNSAVTARSLDHDVVGPALARCG